MPCAGLAPSVPTVCLGGVPALSLSAAMPRCRCGGSAVLGPLIGLLSSQLSPCTPVARVVGGFSSPPCPVRPPSVRPRLRWSLWGFCPPGATHSLRGCCFPVATRLPYPLPGRTPVVFRHSGGLAAPLLVPHSGGLVGHSRGLAASVVAPHSRCFSRLIFPPASFSPPLRLPLPMATLLSCLVGGHGGGFIGVTPTGPRFPM